MTTVANSIARIRAYFRAAQLSKKAFADQAGVRDTLLRDIDKPDWNPTVKTLTRLEEAIPSDFDHIAEDAA